MSLRLRVALPVVQVLIAGALMQWAYRTPTPRGWEYFVPLGRLLALGLDAPARLSWLLDPDFFGSIVSSRPLEGPVFPWLPESIVGFQRDDVLLLIGAAITWYLVGRAADRRIDGVEGSGMSLKLAFGYVLMFGLGVCLVGTGVHDLGPNGYETTIPRVDAVFSLIWAAALIFIPVRATIRLIQGRRIARAS